MTDLPTTLRKLKEENAALKMENAALKMENALLRKLLNTLHSNILTKAAHKKMRAAITKDAAK